MYCVWFRVVNLFEWIGVMKIGFGILKVILEGEV